MLAQIIGITAVVVILALWLHGRHQRSQWPDTPEVKSAFQETVRSDTAIVFFPGAFNSTHVADGLVWMWRHYGDVYLVEYPLGRLDPDKTIRAVNSYFNQPDRRYQRFVLIGASMGGILALKLYRSWNHPKAPGWGKQVGIIGCDVPQCADHLAWPARLVPFIHPGPLTNGLLRWVPSVVFRPQYDKLSEGTDIPGLERHIAAMRRFWMSAWCDHLAVIVKSKLQDPAHFAGVRSFYLRSATDDVIKAAPAENAWGTTFPQAGWYTIEKAFHATFMEHKPEWWDGFVAAFGYLQVPPVHR